MCVYILIRLSVKPVCTISRRYEGSRRVDRAERSDYDREPVHSPENIFIDLRRYFRVSPCLLIHYTLYVYRLLHRGCRFQVHRSSEEVIHDEYKKFNALVMTEATNRKIPCIFEKKNQRLHRIENNSDIINSSIISVYNFFSSYS